MKKILSYFIILLILLVIGLSSRNSIDLINHKQIVFYKPTLPDMKDRYLLEPVMDLITADVNH
jgi:hypothetical protein